MPETLAEAAFVFATPNGGERKLTQPNPAEIYVVDNGDTITVHNDTGIGHPYTFGDGSLVTDPTADKFVVASWRFDGIHNSVRQCPMNC